MISIIVPIYNVSSYIERCIESIVNQTYSNLEIILVDDGSPDDCPEICDKWAKKDERIRVLHKKNGGQAEARNMAIDTSTGDYILFVDGDDYILPNMCEDLVKVIEQFNTDIVVCNYFFEYGDRHVDDIMPIESAVYERKAIMELYFKEKYPALVAPWCKLYRRDLFFNDEHIRYPVGVLHEDEFTSYRLFYAAHSTVVIKDVLYGYVQRSGSDTASVDVKHIRDINLAVKGYVSWGHEKEENYLVSLVDIAAQDWYYSLVKQGITWKDDIVTFECLVMEFYKYIRLHTQSPFSNIYATKQQKKRYILMQLNLLHGYYWCRSNWRRLMGKKKDMK